MKRWRCGIHIICLGFIGMPKMNGTHTCCLRALVVVFDRLPSLLSSSSLSNPISLSRSLSLLCLLLFFRSSSSSSSIYDVSPFHKIIIIEPSPSTILLSNPLSNDFTQFTRPLSLSLSDYIIYLLLLTTTPQHYISFQPSYCLHTIHLRPLFPTINNVVSLLSTH